jgi:peptide deformylase
MVARGGAGVLDPPMQETAVVLYPDPRLGRPAEAVTIFDADLKIDCDRLLAALKSLPAIGLAGPHLGIMRRIVAIDLGSPAGSPGARVFVNPVVTWASSETNAFAEGSVSLPGVQETLVRPAQVRVGWTTLAGEPREEEFDGFMAACLQHEIDQCDGVFWLDRLSRLKRDRALARFRKLRR